MENKYIKRAFEIHNKLHNTYDTELLAIWENEVKNIINKKDKEIIERKKFLESLFIDIKDKIKNIKESEYYGKYFVVAFHVAKFYDHCPEEWQQNAVRHPKKNWVIVAQPDIFKYATATELKNKKLVPIVRNAEELKFFSTRKEQIIELYEFVLWKKDLICIEDFELKEYDNKIILYPIKEKKGLFIGRGGDNVKFVSEVLKKPVIIK